MIDLAGVTHRRYGGVGFALGALPVEVEAGLAFDSTLDHGQGMSPRDEADTQSLVGRLAARLGAHFAVRVRRSPPQHVGLGSKTAMLLAIGAACNMCVGSPLSKEELQGLSGRGGASGVGINTFFDGGVIVDLGHPESSDGVFAPSSAGLPPSLPPVCVRLEFPREWFVHLFLPSGHEYAGDDETAFFDRNTPIPGEEALRVLAAVYHGFIPSLVERDIRLLKQSIADMHASGFKKREMAGQSACVRSLVALLGDHEDLAVGLSSMGPLVYAIGPADNVDMLARLGAAVQEKGQGTYLGAFPGRNAGHESSRGPYA